MHLVVNLGDLLPREAGGFFSTRIMVSYTKYSEFKCVTCFSVESEAVNERRSHKKNAQSDIKRSVF